MYGRPGMCQQSKNKMWIIVPLFGCFVCNCKQTTVVLPPLHLSPTFFHFISPSASFMVLSSLVPWVFTCPQCLCSDFCSQGGLTKHQILFIMSVSQTMTIQQQSNVYLLLSPSHQWSIYSIQGHWYAKGTAANVKGEKCGPDPQHKPYGALMVWFRDKYWSPGIHARSQELRGVMELDEQGDVEEVEGIWNWQGCEMIWQGWNKMIQYESIKGSKVTRQGKV